MKRKISLALGSIALGAALLMGSFNEAKAVTCTPNGAAIDLGDGVTMYGYDCSDGSTRYITVFEG